MYTISFYSPEAQTEVRAAGAHESKAKATNYAKKLAESFQDVVVWQGQPGELRVATLNSRCDAQLYGDRCAICNNGARA